MSIGLKKRENLTNYFAFLITGKKMNKPVLILSSLFLAACGGGSDSSSVSSQPTNTVTETSTEVDTAQRLPSSLPDSFFISNSDTDGTAIFVTTNKTSYFISNTYAGVFTSGVDSETSLAGQGELYVLADGSIESAEVFSNLVYSDEYTQLTQVDDVLISSDTLDLSNSGSFVSLNVSNKIVDIVGRWTNQSDVYVSVSFEGDFIGRDQQGCEYIGQIDWSSTGIHFLEATVSSCASKGDYVGYVLATELEGEAAISWALFNTDGILFDTFAPELVNTSIDGQLIDSTIVLGDHKASLEGDKQLLPGVYTNAELDAFVIRKGNQLFVADLASSYSTQIIGQYDLFTGSEDKVVAGSNEVFLKKVNDVEVEQNGQSLEELNESLESINVSIALLDDNRNRLSVATIGDNLPEAPFNKAILSYVYDKNADGQPDEETLDLNYDLRGSNIATSISAYAGDWSGLNISVSGGISGKLGDDCNITGNISNFDSGVAHVEAELSNCNRAGSYSGAISYVYDFVFNDNSARLLFAISGSHDIFTVYTK